MPPTFNSYIEFVERFVLPIAEKNPHWLQLDGKDGKHSRAAAAYFLHEGEKYKADVDNRFDILLSVYRYMTKNTMATDSLIVKPTRKKTLRSGRITGGNPCLRPNPIIGPEKGFYAYRVLKK